MPDSPLPSEESVQFTEAWYVTKALVSAFVSNKNYYVGSGTYQEAEVRTDFIDKLFIALGWDVSHEHQRDPYRQEVKIEKSDLKRKSGRADYAFFVAPLFKRVRFFVEAKRPQLDIKTPDNCFQTIRYAWPHQIPISILTDFSSIHVLDTRYRPKIDSAVSRVVRSWSCEDLLTEEKFAEVYWLLSREAVANGSIESFAENILPIQRVAERQYSLFRAETRPFDDDFLAKLDEWRQQLAVAFKAADRSLDGRQLTEAVQRTLDRLIFIRFLEDKLIEERSIVSTFGSGKKTSWRDFISASARLDQIYNGTVFKKHPVVDKESFELTGSDFSEICDELTDEHSPYNFDSIPVEILGRIYERFLGSIVVTKSDRIRIEEKDDVRKAGGVYYTPDYIVNYIVDNSLGSLLRGKKPEEILKVRVLDTSCGSGSFLIGAFDFIMHAVLAQHRSSKVERKDLVEERNGQLYLTIQYKRQILLKCIYGVDIDPQAVEVAHLSLYLKLLEDETTFSARAQQLEMGAALLPSLNQNVVCGNSLIDPDRSDDLFSVDRIKLLNGVSFKKEFADVFRQGGFDLLIGNPPYIKEYVNRRAFDHVRNSPYYQGKMDIWYLFACQGLELLKERHGMLAFIATNNWVTNTGAKKLRRKIAEDARIEQLIDFGSYHVFKGVGIQTMILIARNASEPLRYEFDFRRLAVKKPTLSDARALLDKSLNVGCEYLSPTFDRTKATAAGPLTFSDSTIESLLEKIEAKQNFWFEGNEEIAQGIVAPQDFLNAAGAGRLGGRYPVGSGIFVLSDFEKTQLKLSARETELLRPYYTTDELRSYYGSKKNRYWIIYTSSQFKNKKAMAAYTNLRTHLDQFSKIITSHNRPYGLHRAREERFFLGEKIVVARKAAVPTFTFTDFPCYVSQTFNVIKTDRVSPYFLTGLLNSRLIRFWLRHRGKMQGHHFQLDKEPLEKLPIHIPSKQEIKRVSELVQRILECCAELEKTRSAAEQEALHRAEMRSIAEIDEIIEKMYGFAADDRRFLASSILSNTVSGRRNLQFETAENNP
jgi:adenine-specific DNA-methyltransferase